jgi:hypothetical protein
MRCRDLASLLSMEDPDARFDPAAASGHLAACSRCATRWPEVALLVGTPDTPSASRRRPAVVAAGLLAVASLAIGALTPHAESVGAGVAAPSRGPNPPRVAAVISTASHETVRFDRGARIESRVTYTTWTAPTPKCLQSGGSGS